MIILQKQKTKKQKTIINILRDIKQEQKHSENV